MKRSSVAHVILGALRADPKSGYEIKQLSDKATRFFWAASYGQIYPELRRLRDEGLIEAVGGSDDARRRVRYRLTESGRGTLVDWLRQPTASYELRDEWLLKLFFADALEPADALELVRSFRAHRQATLERLHAIDAEAAKSYAPFTAVVLEYGLEMYEWAVEWCSRLEARLEQEQATRQGVRR